MQSPSNDEERRIDLKADGRPLTKFLTMITCPICKTNGKLTEVPDLWFILTCPHCAATVMVIAIYLNSNGNIGIDVVEIDREDAAKLEVGTLLYG